MVLSIYFVIFLSVIGLSAIKIYITTGVYRQMFIEFISLLTDLIVIRIEFCKVFVGIRVSVIRLRAHNIIHPVQTFFFSCFCIICQKLTDRLLNENIIIESRVSVEDRHKSGNLRPVRNMIRRITRRREDLTSIIRAVSHIDKRTCDQVMDHCRTLGAKAPRNLGQKNIIVHQGRSVRHFNKDILCHRNMLIKFRPFRRHVTVE